jgi:hypothetical protein
MSRLLSALAALYVALALPAQAQSPARILELGITGGVSHHDFHYRYPGEGRWEDLLGLRLDVRFRNTGRGALGVAAIVDRYVYSVASGYCISDCITMLSNATTGENVLWFSTAWQVTRLGLGGTWQRQLIGPAHANLGVLAGRSWRQTLDDAPPNGPLPATTQEWFAGLEAGMTIHWRELGFGVGGEYGRVPRTEYALNPYYGRVVARVAYRTAW